MNPWSPSMPLSAVQKQAQVKTGDQGIVNEKPEHTSDYDKGKNRFINSRLCF